MASKTIKAMRPNKIAFIPSLRACLSTRGAYAVSLRRIGVPLTASTNRKFFTPMDLGERRRLGEQ